MNNKLTNRLLFVVMFSFGLNNVSSGSFIISVDHGDDQMETPETLEGLIRPKSWRSNVFQEGEEPNDRPIIGNKNKMCGGLGFSATKVSISTK